MLQPTIRNASDVQIGIEWPKLGEQLGRVVANAGAMAQRGTVIEGDAHRHEKRSLAAGCFGLDRMIRPGRKKEIPSYQWADKPVRRRIMRVVLVRLDYREFPATHATPPERAARAADLSQPPYSLKYRCEVRGRARKWRKPVVFPRTFIFSKYTVRSVSL